MTKSPSLWKLDEALQPFARVCWSLVNSLRQTLLELDGVVAHRACHTALPPIMMDRRNLPN
jgi:hypothetical protein